MPNVEELLRAELTIVKAVQEESFARVYTYRNPSLVARS
jgi:hypothetical protein